MSLAKFVTSTLTRVSLKCAVLSLKPNFFIPTRNSRIMWTRRNRLMYHRAQEHEAIDPGPTVRREFLDWNQRAEMFAFSKRLSENMSEQMLTTVFTDESYAEKERKQREELGMGDVPFEFQHNKLLAHKGLKLVADLIPKYLRYFLPKLPEEGIKALRDFLLNQGNLADMSKQLGTEELIMCASKFPDEEQMVRALQAFIGGLIEEQGPDHAQKFIIDFILTYLQSQHIFEIWDFDARQAVNVILANDKLPPYEPRIVYETGRNTIEPCFAVGLFVNREIVSWAAAESEAEAEEMAAFDALKRWFEIRPSDFVIKNS